jgi:transposase, IS6 family
VDHYGQIIDVYVSPRRNIAAARRFFTAALAGHGEAEEVVTGLARALAQVVGELLPAAFHNTEQYAYYRVECDHGRLKARLGPIRGLKTETTAQVVIGGHALAQNIRRGHYELGSDTHPRLGLATAFDELRPAI